VDNIFMPLLVRDMFFSETDNGEALRKVGWLWRERTEFSWGWSGGGQKCQR